MKIDTQWCYCETCHTTQKPGVDSMVRRGEKPHFTGRYKGGVRETCSGVLVPIGPVEDCSVVSEPPAGYKA